MQTPDLIQNMANIYALSDKVVCYSEAVKWCHTFTLAAELMSDHTLLDDFYHELQGELNYRDEEPMTGQSLSQ